MLTRKVKEEDIRAFTNAALSYDDQADRKRADAILQISSTANEQVYKELVRRDPEMCATLMEIMKDDIDRKVQDGVRQGMQQGIQQGMQQGIQQGMQQGTDQGLGDATKLMNYLWKHGRGEDAEKAEKDRNFLKKLLDEFKNMETAIN